MIHRGTDPSLRREVAIKVLSGGGGDATVRDRFVAEARVTAQLEHPNIIPVYELVDDESACCYFAMKLVRGMSLAERLAAIHSRRERGRRWDHFQA